MNRTLNVFAIAVTARLASGVTAITNSWRLSALRFSLSCDVQIGAQSGSPPTYVP